MIDRDPDRHRHRDRDISVRRYKNSTSDLYSLVQTDTRASARLLFFLSFFRSFANIHSQFRIITATLGPAISTAAGRRITDT